MTNSVLKLDASFRPVKMIPWHEAIRLIYLDKATVVEESPDEFWCSPTTRMRKPLVIQVHHYIKIKKNKNNGMAVKSILYLRDEGKCSYCRVELTLKESTKDHVIPRSRGESLGMTKQQINAYENLVLCCKPCNHKKGNKLPYECKMYPHKTPKAPDYVPTVIRGVKHPIHRQYVEYWYKLPEDPNAAAEEVKA